MSRFRPPVKAWQTAVVILSLIAAVVVKMNQSAGNRATGRAIQPGTTAADKGTRKPSAWKRLTDCELVEDRNNDGDSFTLRYQGTTGTFRLYFVDCPEKQRLPVNGDRIAEQGRYFGGLSEDATIAIGSAAREFTMALLRKGPIVVETREESVMSSERMYAFVAAGGDDLAEALVSRGLARIHTRGASRPDRREADQRKILQRLEAGAKARRVGAWGVL